MINAAFIPFLSSRIHYNFFGQGPKILFCFHGYNESVCAFHFLESSLNNEFFLIAVDLPFHGQTEWKEGREFTVLDLSAIIEGIRQQHGRTTGPISLAGHSLGARIALCLLQQYPGAIDKVLLMAPDGLDKNYWFKLATGTEWGVRFFSLSMQRPGWLLAMLQLARYFKFMHKSVHAFVIRHIQSEEARKDLYQRWTALRAFRPNLPLIRSLVKNKRISVSLIYGRDDRITVSKSGTAFSLGLAPLCQVHIVDCGHRVLHKSQGALIIRLLTS